MKIIILIGQRVRSGTNFLGSTLSRHPEIQTIPPSSSHGEFNLFQNRLFEESLENITEKSFGVKYSDEQVSDHYRMYGELVYNQLQEKYNLVEDKTVFVKSPFIENYDLWLKAFPEAKFIFLCRDGRDNVISSVKASMIKKRWFNFKRVVKLNLNYYSGRFFIKHLLDWKKMAAIFVSVPNQANIYKVKYEELVNSRGDIKNLLDFLNLDSTDVSVDLCLSAPVVGSSFGKNTGVKNKSNWVPEYDKSKFTFTQKWKKWGWFKAMIFSKIAGDELLLLGYKSD